jgi:hypothetical protein
MSPRRVRRTAGPRPQARCAARGRAAPGRDDSKAARSPCTPRAASLFRARQLLPVLPARNAARPTTTHCFEAKPPCLHAQLAYLRLPSRLACAHTGQLHELRRDAMHSAWASSCSCSLPRLHELPSALPRSHRSPEPRASPRSCRASLGIRPPQPAPPATAARRHHRPPDRQPRLKSTLGEP